MVDEETTISMAGINAPPLYRLVEDGDKTVIMTADTNTPMWVINGKIGGDTVETMTTAERTAITPDAGELIYDSDEDVLYLGDGVTPGGNALGGSGGGDYIAGAGITITGGATISRAAYGTIETVDVSGASPSVTMVPGHAYSINATAKAVTLNVASFNSNQFGIDDGHLEIFVANTGHVVTGANVELANALEPDAINYCTVRFVGGVAKIALEDNIGGYVVTTATGTTAGTLPYALSSASQEYVAFDATLNGQTLDLAGATTYAGEKHVVGNGYAETILSGGITCTSKTTFSNLSMDGVVASGGTMTLGDALIPSGSTVGVASGARARVERATLDGVISGGVSIAPGGHLVGSGSIDLGGSAYFGAVSSCIVSGVSIFNGNGSSFGSAGVAHLADGALIENVYVSGCVGSKGGAFSIDSGTLSNCIISGCSNDGRGGAVQEGYIGATEALHAKITGCTIAGCTAAWGWNGGGLAIMGSNTTVDITSSLISGNIVISGTNVKDDIWLHGLASANISGSTIGVIRGGTCTLSGKNKIDLIDGGTPTLASGAVLDLTGNTNPTPISPNGGVIVEGGCQVITSAGSTVSIAGGTYTKINNDGTTE